MDSTVNHIATTLNESNRNRNAIADLIDFLAAKEMISINFVEVGIGQVIADEVDRLFTVTKK